MFKRMLYLGMICLIIPNSVLIDMTTDNLHGKNFRNIQRETINKTKQTQGQERNEVVDSFKKELLIVLLKELRLEKENVARSIKLLNIKYPKMVYRQAMLESGWTLSYLATKYNNLFGMKLPRNRKTYATGETESGYAIYAHWVYSILDYLEWQNMHNPNKYLNYIEYLKARFYFDDKNYVSKLMSISIKNVKFILE